MTLIGDADGATFEPKKDRGRLNAQRIRVWNAMRNQVWRTLSEIARITGDPEASVSARLRDFRKLKFGAHDVPKERVSENSGLYRYRVIPNPASPEIA